MQQRYDAFNSYSESGAALGCPSNQMAFPKVGIHRPGRAEQQTGAGLVGVQSHGCGSGAPSPIAFLSPDLLSFNLLDFGSLDGDPKKVRAICMAPQARRPTSHSFGRWRPRTGNDYCEPFRMCPSLSFLVPCSSFPLPLVFHSLS